MVTGYVTSNLLSSSSTRVVAAIRGIGTEDVLAAYQRNYDENDYSCGFTGMYDCRYAAKRITRELADKMHIKY